jgi:putative ABC transport system permease protein
VNPLHRKLLRDLWGLRGPAATIALVVGLGITGLMGFLGLHRDLLTSRNRYYRSHAYADLQLTLRRAPRSAVDHLVDLPGIEALEGRISERVSVEFEDQVRRVAGRMLSLPDAGEAAVNRLRLVAGRLPEPGGRDEVVVLDDFGRARGLRPGAQLRVVVEETTHTLTVVGWAMSPEYVYVLPEDGGFVPEPKRFAVMWGRRRLVERLTNMAGAVNDVILRAGRGTDPAALQQLLEAHLAPYGVLVSNLREDLAPYSLLKNEIRFTLIRAYTVPTIFLIASALVLNLVLTRLVATQRVQIGTLKALGVPSRSILVHYMSFALVISLAGAAGGIWGGHRLNQLLLDLYERFYRLPRYAPIFHWDLALAGAGAAAFAALAGILRTCLGVLALTPAVAMRPAPPETRSSALVPRLRRLPLLWRLSLRTTLRHPFRSIVSVVGMALAVALLMTSRFFLEAITVTNLFNFQVSQRQDMEVQLLDGVGEESLAEVAHLPGVTTVEAILQHPFEASSGRRRRRVVLEGYEPDSWLRRPRTMEGEAVPLPDRGVLLSESLAGALRVEPGDVVTLRSLRGRRRTQEVPVAGTYVTFQGRSGAARRDVLARLIEEPRAISVIGFDADVVDDTLEEALTRRPAVLRVTRREEKIEGFVENVQGVIEVANNILVFLSGAIACGMLLNGALVGLAERRGELAVLRVQGFSLREVGDLLLYEHLITGGFGMLLGIPMGTGLISWVHSHTQTEILRLPFVVSRFNMARAELLALFFLLAAHVVVRVVLSRMEWRENLAVKE